MNTVDTHSPEDPPVNTGVILQNVVVGLTVSFVALSLGAALGMLSGRGAFSGMVSAGLIVLVTSLFGGTRVECSGPTAPMSAVTAVTVAYAHEQLDTTFGITPDQFVILALIGCGMMLVVMSLLRLGRFIRLVPNVVISGFMNGIAVLIWLDQLRLLLGFGGKSALAGPFLENLAVTIGTLVMIFALSPLMRRVVGPKARYLPATLVAIVIATLMAAALHLPIEHIQLTGSMTSLDQFGALLFAQWPRDWSWPILLMAAPLALQLAFLCYIDTLLTSLVIDKMSGETTRQDKELCARGSPMERLP
ncbi:MAG: SulP family inorganic anion transporter [Desulfuromonadales bacterium]|nr:SulP family inorganic anion transporter [Desulfuromonadales bacterium]